jgi:hypothetical protein
VSVQVDIEYLIRALQAGIGLVPPVLIAIVLLGGPTAGWLLYRFVVQPRTRRRFGRSDAASMWVCPNCRSVNELRMRRCYRCDALPDQAEMEVIDARPTGPVPLTPVGPGLDLGGPSTPRPRPISRIERAEEVWVEDETWERLEARRDRAALPDVAAMTEVAEASHGRRVARPPAPIPVGPGRQASRPAVARPRRAVVAGGPAASPAEDPDDTPAA